MANLVVTNVDRGGVILDDVLSQDEILTFAAADTFVAGTILGRVTASGKLVPFAPAASDGSEVPLAVLAYEVSRGSAGDTPIRALVAGKVKKERLVIDADGDGDNITKAHLDTLRSYQILAVDTEQLARLDNQ